MRRRAPAFALALAALVALCTLHGAAAFAANHNDQDGTHTVCPVLDSSMARPADPVHIPQVVAASGGPAVPVPLKAVGAMHLFPIEAVAASSLTTRPLRL